MNVQPLKWCSAHQIHPPTPTHTHTLACVIKTLLRHTPDWHAIVLPWGESFDSALGIFRQACWYSILFDTVCCLSRWPFTCPDWSNLCCLETSDFILCLLSNICLFTWDILQRSWDVPHRSIPNKQKNERSLYGFCRL